jgi:hypothetical protein
MFSFQKNVLTATDRKLRITTRQVSHSTIHPIVIFNSVNDTRKTIPALMVSQKEALIKNFQLKINAAS